MTRFENIGAELQYGSQNKKAAITRLAKSCQICCQNGLRIDCERCAIMQAHEFIMGCLSVPMKANAIA